MSSPTHFAFIIGEALIDAVTTTDGVTKEHPGGSPANVALTLGRLGRSAHLLTWIGQDVRGRTIEQWLQESRVHIEPASAGARATSLAHASLSASGSATYQFDLEWDLPPVQVPAGAVIAHTGSIAAILQPGGAKVRALLEAARDTATITYDPNMRPTLMGSPDEVRPHVETYVGLSDVVKASDEDLEWLYPGIDPRDVARRWQAGGPALVVVTFGGEGAFAVTSQDELTVAAPQTTVADTVGAGDSFMGALLHGLWEQGLVGSVERQNLHAINSATLETVLLQCTKVAAVTVSRAGANPPWLAELDE